jgi:hypothetical protein
MPMDKKQIASLQRHAERFTARHGYGDKPLPLFIRVAESKIYHGKPMHKALLKEVIYLRMTDLHKDDTRIPKGTPWSNDYTKYEGWTYASQKYLANRVGSKDHTYVSTVLSEIEKDGFIETRSHSIPKKGFQRKKQYFALEEAIDAKIAELGFIEEESDANSDGSTQLGLTQPASWDKPNPPVGINQTARLDKPNSPVGINPKELGSVVGLSEGVEVARTYRTPLAASPSGKVSAAPLSNQEKEKTNPVGALGCEAEDKAKTTPKAKAATASKRGGIIGFDGEPVGFDVEEA